MNRSLLAIALTAGLIGTAYAGPATDNASTHFAAIASGDLSVLMRGYHDAAQLQWVGGPLDGSYSGAAAIRGVWEKFEKAQGPLQATVEAIAESANRQGADQGALRPGLSRRSRRLRDVADRSEAGHRCGGPCSTGVVLLTTFNADDPLRLYENAMKTRTLFATSVAVALLTTLAHADPAPKMTGGVLADAAGKTLYTFDKDAARSGRSVCNDTCAALWPPAMASADAKAEKDFTSITRDDGSKQWAFKGKPLYAYVQDQRSGDTMGDGFKGVWHVAK
jgi:predicted lipoprotein with Yx(FWY)xxD motif